MGRAIIDKELMFGSKIRINRINKTLLLNFAIVQQGIPLPDNTELAVEARVYEGTFVYNIQIYTHTIFMSKL